MPVKLYLQVIGQTQKIPGLEDCLADDLTIRQLPVAIKSALFHRRVFSRRLNDLLDVLRKLKLVGCQEEHSTSYEAMHLERHGEIEDRISERSGTVRRYTFNTFADIMKYWTELEYISLARIVIEDEENGEESQSKLEEDNEDEMGGGGGGSTGGGGPNNNGGKDPFGGTLPELTRRANWSSLKPLNRAQISVLDQHEFAHAPTKAEITYLATQYHIPTVQVMNHYKLKMKKRAQHTLTRRTATRTTRKRTVTSGLPTTRKGRKRKSATDDGSGLVDDSGRPRISFAIDTSRRKRKRAALPRLDMERREDEDEDESLDEAARAAAVPQRTNWLPDEDLALIRTFVHVRAEAGTEEREASEDELWVHIGRLMSKPASVCKQRIHSLLKGQHLEPAVQILIDHLNRRDAAPLTRSETPLPETVEEVGQRYLIAAPFKSAPLPPVAPIISAAEDMYKMILLMGTRGEEVAEWAWRLFPYFTEDELDLALQRLRQAGLIVKARGREGVRFQLSDKFKKMCVSHKLNTLSEEAREFAQQIREGSALTIGPMTNGGSVAHLLSLLHDGSVRAVPDLPDLPPEALAPEGGEERSGRGGVVLHLMGKKRVLSGPYRTANLQLDVFAWTIGLETRGDINLEQCVGAFAPVLPIAASGGAAGGGDEEGRQQRDRPPGLHELLPGRSGEEDRQQGREASAAARKRPSLEPVLGYLCAAEASPALVAAVESLYRFIARSETSGVTATDLLEHRRQEEMRAADQEEALRHLLNFENVVEVAAYEQRLWVADESVDRWSWMPLPSASCGEGHILPPLPPLDNPQPAAAAAATAAEVQAPPSRAEPAAAAAAAARAPTRRDKGKEKETETMEGNGGDDNTDDPMLTMAIADDQASAASASSGTPEKAPKKKKKRGAKANKEHIALMNSAGEPTPTEVIRPWKMLDGSINQQFLSNLRRRIYGIILHHPGIYQQTIVEEMELLGAESVREVIRSLLVDDCIYARAITFERPSLFSAPEPFDAIVLPGRVSSWDTEPSLLLGMPSAGQQQQQGLEMDNHVCYFVRPSALARI